MLGLCFAIVNPFSRGEKISWTPPNSDKLNSPLFHWEQGGDRNSYYELRSSNTLKITAAPKTDLKLTPDDQRKQSPMMVFSTQGDFEASVKVSFKSSTNFQRAVLGVRDANDKYQQVLIYLMENSRLETAIFNLGQSQTLADPFNHNSEFMYLKIKRHLGSIALFYSYNGWQWSVVASEFQSSLSNEVKFFFGVFSAHNPNTAVAEFSDFSLKRL